MLLIFPTLQLIFNIISIIIEAFIESGHKFFYPLIVESFRLWCKPLPHCCFDFIVAMKTLATEDRVEVQEDMKVTRSQIRAVGGWSICSQPNFEIRFWLSRAVCGRALSWSNTTPLVSIPCLLFWIAIFYYWTDGKYVTVSRQGAQPNNWLMEILVRIS